MEKDNKKIIRSTNKNKDLFSGPLAGQGPDLVLLSNSGFNLRGSIAKNVVFEKDIFTGKHAQDDAFLFVKTPQKIEIPECVKVSDIVGIMNQMI